MSNNQPAPMSEVINSQGREMVKVRMMNEQGMMVSRLSEPSEQVSNDLPIYTALDNAYIKVFFSRTCGEVGQGKQMMTVRMPKMQDQEFIVPNGSFSEMLAHARMYINDLLNGDNLSHLVLMNRLNELPKPSKMPWPVNR